MQLFAYKMVIYEVEYANHKATVRRNKVTFVRQKLQLKRKKNTYLLIFLKDVKADRVNYLRNLFENSHYFFYNSIWCH